MSTVRVLAFSANQVSNSLDVDSELRAIRQALDGVAVVEHLPAARAEELVSDLSANPPVVMHFMGHGSPLGLELAYGRDDYRPADGRALRDVLDGRGVQLVVLSSCYSAIQANQIAQSVSVVVGTRDELEDESTAMFSNAFYKALRRGATAAEALRDGQDSVRLQHGGDQFEIVGDKEWKLTTAEATRAQTTRPPRRRLQMLIAAALGVAAVALLAFAVNGFGGGGTEETSATSDGGTAGEEDGNQVSDDVDVGVAGSHDDDDDASSDPNAESNDSDDSNGGGDDSGEVASSVVDGLINDDPPCASGALAPTALPFGGEVSAGDEGCPVLASSIVAPSGVDRWSVSLVDGQVVSYDVASNIRFAWFRVVAPDGSVVTEVLEDSSFRDSFTAAGGGEYVFEFAAANDTRTRYTAKLFLVG